MRGDRRVVDWYRSCIHEQQRKASTLTIEVGLGAQDGDDPRALAETMECLDTAIEILEQAKAIAKAASDTGAPVPEPDASAQADSLMDDLGHSMSSISLQAGFSAAMTEEDIRRFFD